MVTTIQAASSTSDLLTDEMLRRFDERAPIYDRENRFFTEDFEELRDSPFMMELPGDEPGVHVDREQRQRDDAQAVLENG